MLPASAIELFVDRAIRSDQLVRTIALIAEVRHHLVGHVIDAVPVLSPDALFRKTRAIKTRRPIVVNRRVQRVIVCQWIAVRGVVSELRNLSVAVVAKLVVAAIRKTHHCENGNAFTIVSTDDLATE